MMDPISFFLFIKLEFYIKNFLSFYFSSIKNGLVKIFELFYALIGNCNLERQKTQKKKKKNQCESNGIQENQNKKGGKRRRKNPIQ